jgi:hypothetical protein
VFGTFAANHDNPNEDRMTNRRILFFIYLLALTVGLVHPQGGAITGLGEHPDLQHFLAFVLLAVLAARARFELAFSTLITALLIYAVAGELVQAAIPGRTASLIDGLANVLGIAVGLGISWKTVSRGDWVKGTDGGEKHKKPQKGI